MKTIEIDKIQPDSLAAALAVTDKETVTVSGYICAVDNATISVSETRDGATYVQYPRSAVVAAFTEEKSDQVTLLVEADARVKAISVMRAGVLNAQAVGGTGCGCEDASAPFFPVGPGVFNSMSHATAAQPGFAPTQDAPPQAAFQSSMGGAGAVGGFGGLGWDREWGCQYVMRYEVCGSAMPGHPRPRCWIRRLRCVSPEGYTTWT